MNIKTFLLGAILATAGNAMAQQSWTADNGNGTFTNPLFYDEFSDPDILRVGDDYYLAGTTMHTVPGSPSSALPCITALCSSASNG